MVSSKNNHDLLADVVSIDEGHKVVGEGHGVADRERRVLIDHILNRGRRIFKVMTNERPIRGWY